MQFAKCSECGYSFKSGTSLNKLSSSRQPLVLKCGHTFCNYCLDRIERKNSTNGTHLIQCPDCTTLTVTKNGTKNLPINIYLLSQIGIEQNNLIEQKLNRIQTGTGGFFKKSKEESIDLMCKMCAKRIPTCKCVECDCVLCSDCFDRVHQISAAIKNHKAVPFPATKQEVSKKIMDPICKEHHKPIEYWCQDDNNLICSRCYISGSHKQHNIISFEEKNKALVPEIESALEEAVLVAQKLHASETKIKKSVPTFKSDAKSLTEKIRCSFLFFHSLLQAREMEILEKLSNSVTESYTAFENQKINLNLMRLNLESSLKDAQRLLQDPACLMDGNVLLDDLREASKIPCIASTNEFLSPLEWDEKCRDDLREAIHTFGNVIGNTEHLIELKTLQEQPDTATNTEKISVFSYFSTKSTCSSSVTNGSLEKLDKIEVASSVGTVEDVVIENSNDTDVEIETSPQNNESNEPDRHNKPSDCQIFEPIVKGPRCPVTVTSICSPNDFYVQFNKNDEKFDNFSRRINNFCKNNLEPPSALMVHELVLAKFKDNNWYRARILDIEIPSPSSGDSSFTVSVYFIDFGNKSKVTKKEIRSMPKWAKKYKSFCFHCSLYDLAPYDENKPWQPNQIIEFHKMTSDKDLTINVIQKTNSVYEVDLITVPLQDVESDGFFSIRDIFIFAELGRFRTHSDAAKCAFSTPAYGSTDFIKPSEILNKEPSQAIVTSVISPSYFYVTCKSDEYYSYLSLVDDMQTTYGKDTSNLYNLYYPRVGTVCACQPDRLWLRGRVIEKPHKMKVKVYLVDVGDVVSVHFSSLKNLHDKYIKLPQQVVLCSLADIAPLDSDDWSLNAIVWTRDKLLNSDVWCSVVRSTDKKDVIIWPVETAGKEEDLSINTLMLNMNFATSTGRYSRPGPSNMQMEIKSQQFPKESIETQPRRQIKKILQRSENDVESTSNKFPSKNTPKKAKDRTTLKKNKVHKKRVVVPNDYENSSEEEEKRLAEKQVQEDIRKAVGSGESSLSSSTDSSEYVQICVSHYESPSCFYIQLKKNIEALDKLIQDMTSYYNSNPELSPEKIIFNKFYAVQSSLDELWYRGKVKKQQEDGMYMVELVDYGKVDILPKENIRKLTGELSNRIDIAAVRCYLNNIIPAGSNDISTWSWTGTEFMQNRIKNRKLFVVMEGSQTALGVPIDLILEDTKPMTAFDPEIKTYYSIRQLLKDQGLAMPYKTLKTINRSSDPFHLVIRNGAESTGEVEVSETDSKESVLDNNTSTAGPMDPSSLSFTVRTMADLPKLPKIENGESFSAVPLHVDMDGKIKIMKLDWHNEANHLTTTLAELYENSVSIPGLKVEVDQLWVSLFPDDNSWYRSKILNQSSSEIQVEYIDYGNTTWVSPNCLRPIDDALLAYHPFSYTCIIDDAVPLHENKSWQTEELDKIHFRMVDKVATVHVNYVRPDGEMEVDFEMEDGYDMLDYLILNNWCCRSLDLSYLSNVSKTIDISLEKMMYEKTILGSVGEVVTGVMTFLELPDIIYIQRCKISDENVTNFAESGEIAAFNEYLDDFVKLSMAIKECKSSQFPSPPSAGMICLGLYHGEWYRALVIQEIREDNTSLVTFVDYGNTDVLSNKCIRQIPEEFRCFPIQSYKCRLNLEPICKSWRPRAIDELRLCLEERELHVKILDTKPLTVELYVAQENLETHETELVLAYQDLIDRKILKHQCRSVNERDIQLTLSPCKSEHGVTEVTKEVDLALQLVTNPLVPDVEVESEVEVESGEDAETEEEEEEDSEEEVDDVEVDKAQSEVTAVASENGSEVD